ncbi:hypothetical protein [Halovivax cerinus]|uniref:Uncharacterized protein n=1 Tax=Halovivax cerinus TaxID=1487865 RepID=A0ABD5NS66_9EURY|nr:hypothetical protein [Halovivax cerinus]
MGSRIEDDRCEDPVRRSESLETLMESTDRTTEEIVEALRESGPRRHVSETNVDDVLDDLSRSLETDADGAFSLSGGPTRTISTTGIDEVFETLEAEAPPLSPDTSQPEVDPSEQRASVTHRRVDAARERSLDDEPTESFGSLSGGDPTRTVSDQSVDDILSLIEEGEASDVDADDPGDDTAAALRPPDAGEQLASLLSDVDEPLGDPDVPPTAGSDDPRADSAGREPEDDRATGATVDRSSAIDIETAAAEMDSLRSPGVDPDDERTAGSDPGEPAAERDSCDGSVETEPVDLPAQPSSKPPSDGGSGTATEATPPSIDPAAPTCESNVADGPRPLVTRAELEEIASLVSDANPDETIANSRQPASTPEPSVTAVGAGSTPTATVDHLAGSNSAGSAVTVADVEPPTDGRPAHATDSRPATTSDARPDTTADDPRDVAETEDSSSSREPDGSSGVDATDRSSASRTLVARIRTFGRHLLRRVRR